MEDCKIIKLRVSGAPSIVARICDQFVQLHAVHLALVVYPALPNLAVDNLMLCYIGRLR